MTLPNLEPRTFELDIAGHKLPFREVTVADYNYLNELIARSEDISGDRVSDETYQAIINLLAATCCVEASHETKRDFFARVPLSKLEDLSAAVERILEFSNLTGGSEPAAEDKKKTDVNLLVPILALVDRGVDISTVYRMPLATFYQIVALIVPSTTENPRANITVEEFNSTLKRKQWPKSAS